MSAWISLKLRLLQVGAIVLISVGVGLLFYKLRPSADSTTVAAKAFPSAEGFGAESIGGRGGSVIEVTNLLDRVPDANGKLITAPGSLRAAVEAKGPRTVVFRVSGNIDLGRSVLEIKEPYLTIAGQTAPGDGITLKNGWVPIKAHDVVMRHIRIRPGPGGYNSARPNGASANVVDVGSTSSYNIVLDHVSMSWGTDETFSISSGAHNVSVQNSIVSEAMHCVPPPFSHSDSELCHSKNILVYGTATDNTFRHNLFAHAIDRNPLIMSGRLEFVNNVTYNYGGPMYVIPRYAPVLADIIGNVFRSGVNSLPGRPEKHEIRLHGNCAGNGKACYGSESSVYINDNLGTDTPTEPFRPARAICPDGEDSCLKRLTSPLNVTALKIEPAEAAYAYVLASAGATIPKRDAVDERIVKDVKNGTGKVINEPGEVGGWPELNSAEPPTDADRDGMPDAWELKHGNNPNDPTDSKVDGTNDGYTNVEKYLNELAGDIDYGDVQFSNPTLPPEPTREPNDEILPSPTPTDDEEPEPEISLEPIPEPSDIALEATATPEPSPQVSSEASIVPTTQANDPGSQIAADAVSSNDTSTTKTGSSTMPSGVSKVQSLPKLLETESAVRVSSGLSPSPTSSSSLKPLILVYPSEKHATDQPTPSNSWDVFIQYVIAGFYSLFDGR